MTDQKKKKLMIVGGIAAVIIAAAVIIWGYADSKVSKIQTTELDEEKLQISEEVEEELEELEDEYVNMAVFGVNIKSEKDAAVDSDAVYVASLNTSTKEIKLMCVYGNAVMNHNGQTIRMKDAYAEDGAESAIAVLNENLDLNIKKYVSINFKAMVDMIDILGGIEIDVKKNEIPHINGYAQGIAEMLGKKAKEVKKPGRQTLDGMQAAGYCRIRVTKGGDVKRTGRQQEVIEKMLGKLKDAGFSQMDQMMDVVFPEVETNFTTEEMLSYGKDAASYSLTSIPAFPREIKPQKKLKKKKGQQFADYEEIVEGVNIEKEVQEIHKELFSE